MCATAVATAEDAAAKDRVEDARNDIQIESNEVAVGVVNAWKRVGTGSARLLSAQR